MSEDSKINKSVPTSNVEANVEPKDEILEKVGANNGEVEAEANEAKAEAVQAFDASKELLYLRAEFENYRKRMARDQEQAVRFANERLAKELLTAVDFFERALEHSASVKKGDPAQVKTFVEGIEMTNRELTQILNRFGVEFVGVKGEKFDPSKHEAITEMESTDIAPGCIVSVLNKGCYFQGRLLQPAKVIVAKEKA